ncbi:MAG: metallophosphoesterase [Planctomycetes bacterium]|nr:metallophosphoesterase [Planctomycetota bacterium]
MPLSRREFITGACAGAAAACIPGERRADAAEPKTATSAGSFSFVHLTDMHVTPKRKGDVGYHKCVESVRALACKPAFALMGGDLAFDGTYNTKADFAEFIRLYKEGSDGLGIPYYNCMGNHDALGFSSRRKVPVDDPDIGKKMIMDRLGWEKSYYSFDHGGWHFVVLDSIYPIQGKDGPTYEPRIGPEQREWLAYDLGAAAGSPTVAVTHIAAFCNRGQINGDPNYKAMDGSMVLWDTKDLRTVLERHKVKALLQGHSHRIEEYRLSGVWYLTSAAVSGAWWAGSWIGSPPGYTVFHCRGDELTWEHVPYPWEPHLEPEDAIERKRIAEQQAFDEEQRRLLERDRAGRRGA